MGIVVTAHQNRVAYAAERAQRGFITFAPDAIAFEERNWSDIPGKAESYELKSRLVAERLCLPRYCTTCQRALIFWLSCRRLIANGSVLSVIPMADGWQSGPRPSMKETETVERLVSEYVAGATATEVGQRYDLAKEQRASAGPGCWRAGTASAAQRG